MMLFKDNHMPDNKKMVRPEDAKRVNIHEPHEVQYWTQTLGVTKDKLIAAVEKAGTSVEAIKKELKK